MRKICLWLILSASVAAACDGDGRTTVDASPADANVPDDGTLGDASALTCAEATAMLASLLYENIGACTVVMRVGYMSREMLAYQAICGAYRQVSEAEARQRAEEDTSYGIDAQMLNAPEPEDEYVFYEREGDIGGVAAVSADTGLTVFGASLVWNGENEIKYPAQWRPGRELGQGCDESNGIAQRHGHDLRTGEVLGQTDVDTALELVEQTAVPAAFWQGGYVFDAVVLYYPGIVGGAAPQDAGPDSGPAQVPPEDELIVMVNGGYLE